MARTWTDEQLVEAVASANSMRQVLRTLGLNATGSSISRSVKRHIVRLGLSTEHFTRGRRWTEQDLRIAVAEQNTWAGVVERLGLSPGGGSSALVRGHSTRLGLDTSHFASYGMLADPTGGAHPFSDEPASAFLREAGPAMAAAWFLRRGNKISWPLEPTSYDLLVEGAQGIQRVQVKTTNAQGRKGWTFSLGCRDGASTRSRNPMRCYTAEELDYFFLIDGDENFYLIPLPLVGGRMAVSSSTLAEFQLSK